MKPDRAEILRYLRMGSAAPDATLAERIDAVEAEVLAVARPRHLADLVPLCSLPDEPTARGGDIPVAAEEAALRIGPLTLRSAALRRALRGARRAYLFAATLGHEVDLLLRRYAATDSADLLIAQAAATAVLEGYADEACETLEGPRTPRFSPGYGDLPLEVQRDFLAAVDGQRRLGITLTDTSLMIPSKSVTAIIGVLS